MCNVCHVFSSEICVFFASSSSSSDPNAPKVLSRFHLSILSLVFCNHILFWSNTTLSYCISIVIQHALSAWQEYSSGDSRKLIKEEFNLETPGEVIRVLGQKWKNLSEIERAPFYEKAAANKKRYQRETAQYKEFGTFTPASSYDSSVDSEGTSSSDSE